jgi:hypothetical protein
VRAGDPRRALRWAQHLVDLAPSDGGAHILLDRIKQAVGH